MKLSFFNPHWHSRHNCIIKVFFSPFLCLLQFIGIKGSIVAWFSNTPSKMVELSAMEIVGTLEPEQSWFHRWFPFLQWSPSSPQALMDAESELLSSKFGYTPSIAEIMRVKNGQKWFVGYFFTERKLC